MSVTISEQQLEEFSTAARQVAQHGLVLCGSGNLSWRVDHEHLLITATGSWLAEMSADKIALCRIADGMSLNGKKPSIEIGFHRVILHERQDINVVLHFQSPYATTLACQKTQESVFAVIPEIPYYIGPVAVVPYLNPGSDELAQTVISAMRAHNLAMMRNHGQVTVGKDFREALQRAIFFEFACGILLRAGDQIQVLSEDAMTFLYQAREKSMQQSRAV